MRAVFGDIYLYTINCFYEPPVFSIPTHTEIDNVVDLPIPIGLISYEISSLTWPLTT